MSKRESGETEVKGEHVDCVSLRLVLSLKGQVFLSKTAFQCA